MMYVYSNHNIQLQQKHSSDIHYIYRSKLTNSKKKTDKNTKWNKRCLSVDNISKWAIHLADRLNLIAPNAHTHRWNNTVVS